MDWRVYFYDNNGDENRSLVVQADTEDEAEIEGEREADRRNWSRSFRISAAEPIGQ